MAYERTEHQEIERVDYGWKECRNAVLKCVTEVCVYRRVGQGIGKRSKWLNDKVRIAVLQKRKVFEQSLQQRSEETFDRYKDERRRVTAVTRKAKREAENRFGNKLRQNFKGNWKIF